MPILFSSSQERYDDSSARLLNNSFKIQLSVLDRIIVNFLSLQSSLLEVMLKSVTLLIVFASTDRWTIGFILVPTTTTHSSIHHDHRPSISIKSSLMKSSSSWDVVDDWETLSQANAPSIPDFDSLNHLDIINLERPRDDDAMDDAIERINLPIIQLDDPQLYDLEESIYESSQNFEEDLSKEIALLVRCNQSPDQLLYQEGRAIRPLTDQERYDVSQLVHEEWKPTEFLIHSVSSLFERYCTKSNNKDNEEEEPMLTAAGVAEWMTIGTGRVIGKNDMRVSLFISKYSTYGTGALSESQLLQVYVDAIQRVVQEEEVRALGHGPVLAKSVWRELENHGIYSPNVQKETDLQRTFYEVTQKSTEAVSIQMDECEILDEIDNKSYPSVASNGINHPGRSSHMSVELCSDKRTPKRIRDGQFVFVDEESCIGCGQCPNIAMTSFVMLDNGRARSFHQATTPEVSQAVSACPVNCIKFVSFDELKELELVRDNGDGRRDHKHLGKEMTPLHVSRRSSDASHKSSWYHHRKTKCSSDKMCPQRGCFDCPFFTNPGDNPYFQKKNRDAERIRAKDIIDSGQGNIWRTLAEL